MRFLKAAMLSIILCLAAVAPAAATQSEADIIMAMVNTWGDTDMGDPEARDALVADALDLHSDTIPGTACHAYSDYVLTAIIINDTMLDRGLLETAIGVSTVRLIGAALAQASEACRLSI